MWNLIAVVIFYGGCAFFILTAWWTFLSMAERLGRIADALERMTEALVGPSVIGATLTKEESN